jgi:G3E family GTPase
MPSVRLILVGGFLGAGKTTLLARATEQLTERGLRVGLVTNDQVKGLVDTVNLSGRGFTVREVAGGCFCCRYSGLVEAVDALANEAHVDVVLAEPVGSCTDLSATVIRPLRQQSGDRFRIAPLTVVVDALRLQELLEGSRGFMLPEEVLYIYRTQLEEADLIVLNKLDLLSEVDAARLCTAAERALPHAELQAISAQTGWGVAEWLERAMSARPSGQQNASVDYDIYAAGEAALGWLNAAADLEASRERDWPGVQTRLLEALRSECAAASAEIAHVKTAIALPGGTLVAGLTTTRGAVVSTLLGQPDLTARKARLTLNARVHLAPEELDAAFARALRVVGGLGVSATIKERVAIRPGPPTPTYRFAQVTPA